MYSLALLLKEKTPLLRPNLFMTKMVNKKNLKEVVHQNHKVLLKIHLLMQSQIYKNKKDQVQIINTIFK
jgi:hypothetical protein